MVDVCLISEETHPRDDTPQAAWIRGLIGALPGVRFSLLVLVGRSPLGPQPWALPANVARVVEFSLDEGPLGQDKKGRSNIDAVGLVQGLVQGLDRRSFGPVSQFYRAVVDRRRRQISPAEFWCQRQVQSLLSQPQYGEWKSMLYRLLRLADLPLPQAQIYHALGCAHAGLAGVLARLEKKVPLVMTYLHEEARRTPQQRRFAQLSRILVCRSASQLVTLYDRQRQSLVRSGAHPGRIQVVPIGFSPPLGAPISPRPADRSAPVVELLGPVVPQRDAALFIRACQQVRQRLPALKFTIATGADDDKRYLRHCRALVDQLQLADCVEFAESARRPDRFDRVALVVALGRVVPWPQVLLAAQSRGCPCLVTDIGGCCELVNGRTAEDLALGPSGLLLSGDLDELVERLVALLEDRDRRRQLGQRAKVRVERFYDGTQLYRTYLGVYRDGLAFGPSRPETRDKSEVSPVQVGG